MAVNASTLRLTGMSSGLDTDSIISSLMKIEQLKLDRQLHARTKLQWKQEAIQGVKSDLTAFKLDFLSVLGSGSITKSDAYNTYKVDVSGANSAAVTLTAGLAASVGSITINKISKLAKGASATSAGTVSTSGAGGTGLSDTNATQLKDLDFAVPLTFDNNDQISFEINGETFTFNNTDTLAKVLSTVNSNTNANVTMTYSRLTDKFTIESKTTGKDSALTITNIAGNAFGSGGGAFGIEAGELKNGQDAELTINDISVTRSVNSFTIDGISYTLNKTSDSAIDAVVSRDVQPAVDRIKAFVEGYNKLVKKLGDMLSETKTTEEKEYTPLTDAEKDELGLSDEEIEEWEAIAKKGILRNDSGIQNMLNSLRTALYERVADAGLSAADIGLKTGEYSLGLKGQIVLDEDKLRAALDADPDRVMNVFTHTSDSTDSAVKYRESGIAERFSAIISKYTDVYESSSLTSLTNSLSDINDRISLLEEKMLAKEEQLYTKFAAMETALASLNSQSEWLSGVLSTNA
jgi:flagellar hook-associated protein 2